MVCLDSDIIINFLRKDKEAIRKISQLKSEELTTTSINAFEILIGFLRFNKSEEGYEFIKNLRILNFDFSASQKAAEISEMLRKDGMTVDLLDLMIASIAITNNEKLLTRNIKHFEKISELKFEI